MKSTFNKTFRTTKSDRRVENGNAPGLNREGTNNPYRQPDQDDAQQSSITPPAPPPYSPSPVPESPLLQSPFFRSPLLQSPFFQSPLLQSPFLQSPSLQSPFFQSPSLQSPVSQIADNGKAVGSQRASEPVSARHPALSSSKDLDTPDVHVAAASALASARTSSDPARGIALLRQALAKMPARGSESLRTQLEDALLKYFDLVLVIDDSFSMRPRWKEVMKVIQAIVKECVASDEDGVDICFLNHENGRRFRNIKKESQVLDMFKKVIPKGATPLGRAVETISQEHLARCKKNPNSTKPESIVIITDGVPTDNLARPIHNVARELDKRRAAPYQLGMQFVQVGDDQAAAEMLRQLDEELPKHGDGCRDIVDTVPFGSTGGVSEDQPLSHKMIRKIRLGGIMDDYDHQETPET